MNRRGYEQITPRIFVDSAASLSTCIEKTEDRVWLSRTVCCDRYTLRGVPAKRLDVIVQQGLDLTGPCLVEVVTKAGRFDGATRPRISVREDNPSIPSERGSISCSWAEDGIRIDVTRQAGPAWCWEGVPLRSQMDDYCPARLVTWHWTRYYQHIPYEPDVRALAESFQIVPGETLAEANRRASRDLYRLARDLGWRKLTLRDQQRYGLEGRQWHREEAVAVAMAERKYPRDGVGQWTHEAAVRPDWA